MDKKCKHCLELKPIEQFYKHPRTKDGHAASCITCRSEYSRNKYQGYDKDKYTKKREELKREVFRLKSVPCAACNTRYPPYAMCFFLAGKRINAAHLGTLNQLIIGTKDSIVMCENCRSVLSSRPCVLRLTKAEKYVRDYKESNPCTDCGKYFYYVSMGFHHTDPENKSDSVSDILGGLDAIMREIEKCILLCRNCHAEREWGINGLSRQRYIH